MILTGKAKEDFEKWLNKEMYYLGRHNFEDRDNNIEDLSDNFQNALIIEWFDEIKHPKIQIVKIIWNTWSNSTLSHKETVIEAIKKANEIYNSK